MPLKAPQVYPGDQRSFDQWTRQVAVTPDPNSVTTAIVQDKAVTDAKLRDSAPVSVIGRGASTPGMPGDIAASTDNLFLVRRSGTLEFGALADSDIPDSLARDSEVTAAIATFAALPDPFTQYETQARADARYVQLSTVLSGSATYDPPSLVDGQGTTTTVTVTGAALGGFARASFSLDLQGITVTAWVSATNTVSVRLQNESGGTLDLASGTLKARVDP